jgi:hypothetical protein
MTDFKWLQCHTEWFLKKFRSRTDELKSSDISRMYTPKKGEPRKGRPENGEKTITEQDFRNLMRLMVSSKHARVTQGHVRSKCYRIKIVNEEYPYIQNLLVNEIPQDLMPDKEMLLKEYIPCIKINWDQKAQDLWALCYMTGKRYSLCFNLYNNSGGDFDLLFDYLQDFSRKFKGEGFNALPMLEDEERELFTLEMNFFVMLYRAFEVGNKVLLDDFVTHGYKSEDTERHFVRVFFSCLRSDLVREFLWALERPARKISDRTYYNNVIKVQSSYRAMINSESIEVKDFCQEEINNEMKPLLEGYKPSVEACWYFDNEEGRKWREILAKSDRPDLKRALAAVEEAFQKRDGFKCSLFRSRSKKPRQCAPSENK